MIHSLSIDDDESSPAWLGDKNEDDTVDNQTKQKNTEINKQIDELILNK